MPDAIVVNDQVVQVNDQQAQRDRLAGLGLPPDLAASEASAWRRWLPGRLPWREIESFQTEITKLDQRRAEIEQKRLDLNERLRVAPEHDARVLAQWQRDGRPGSRPAPSGLQLEDELRQLQADEVALIRAADAVASERATFVQRHRARLVADAAKAEDKALERAQRALNELEQTREALVQTRRVRLWAELYPSQVVGREPVWQQLAGGLRRVLEPLGVQSPVALAAVLSAMREDLSWVASAASPAQRAELPDARPLTQEERDRARDRQFEGVGQLYTQAAEDRRAAELQRVKTAVKSRPRR